MTDLGKLATYALIVWLLEKKKERTTTYNEFAHFASIKPWLLSHKSMPMVGERHSKVGCMAFIYGK